MTAERKITLFTSSLAGGGAEGVCVNVANGLAELGWDVTIVVLHNNKSVYDKEVSKNVKYIILNVNNARYSFIELYKYLKSERLQKIIVFNYELAVILILIRKFTCLKFKIISRNINSLSEKKKNYERSWRSKILFWLIFKIYKDSDHIVNQCKAMNEDLISIFPELKYKTTVIYNPINNAIENYSLTAQCYTEKQTNYLLFIGRIEKQKALHNILYAFSNIHNSFPGLRLKIVGKGSLVTSIKKLAVRLDLQEHIDFLGFTSSTIPLYTNARATLLSSLYEGFPNVLVESIALGTPVVSFDCLSGPQEIIIDGVNGFLSKNKDVDDFTVKIKEILSANLSKSQIINSSKRFSSEKIIPQWEDLILKV